LNVVNSFHLAGRIANFALGAAEAPTFVGFKAKLTMLERLFEQYVPKQEPVTKTKVDLFA
jgi:hypothetical protein